MVFNLNIFVITYGKTHHPYLQQWLSGQRQHNHSLVHLSMKSLILLLLKLLLITWLYSRLKLQSKLMSSSHSSNIILILTSLILSVMDFVKVSGPGLIPCVKAFLPHMTNLDPLLQMSNMLHSYENNVSRNNSKAITHPLLAQTFYLACIPCQSMQSQNHTQIIYAWSLIIVQAPFLSIV